MEDKPCLLSQGKAKGSRGGKLGGTRNRGCSRGCVGHKDKGSLDTRTHCDTAFVVDELADVFIQVPLVLVEIGQQHRQLLLKRQRLGRSDLIGSLLGCRQCLSVL